ncbi:collagen alpha-1(XX) chain-like [Elysia marginata]|uniref:Collagen alpha-1(XX) chain-like n=1 Tax=Elysia marginata TaxID=1093978 RepID=A0AAV4IY08_9GAST|nr:collagen alpha-1(XX) chain-like [Elysia marginata]
MTKIVVQSHTHILDVDGNQQQPQQPQRPQQPNTSGCRGFADVVILLDSSGSIGDENFRKQLDFVSRVVSSFQLSGDQARSGYQFSVVSFSQEVKEEFPLNRYKTQQQLRDVSTEGLVASC